MKKENSHLIKLVVTCLAIIALYLALSFEPVYGYQAANLGRLSFPGVSPIDLTDGPQLSLSQSIQTSTGIPENLDLGDDYYPKVNTDAGDDSDGTRTVPTIPEPASLMLMALGAGVLGLTRKLKK